MKKIKTFLLLGLICLFTISWIYVDNNGEAVEAGKFDHPRKIGKQDKKGNPLVVYQDEIYEQVSHRVAYVPFLTKDSSLITMDEYFRVIDGFLKKGVMIVYIYNGPAFGYAVYDFVEERGFSLIDMDCDGEADTKASYDMIILIPDCLYEYKTNETN